MGEDTNGSYLDKSKQKQAFKKGGKMSHLKITKDNRPRYLNTKMCVHI